MVTKKLCSTLNTAASGGEQQHSISFNATCLTTVDFDSDITLICVCARVWVRVYNSGCVGLCLCYCILVSHDLNAVSNTLILVITLSTGIKHELSAALNPQGSESG